MLTLGRKSFAHSANEVGITPAPESCLGIIRNVRAVEYTKGCLEWTPTGKQGRLVPFAGVVRMTTTAARRIEYPATSFELRVRADDRDMAYEHESRDQQICADRA